MNAPLEDVDRARGTQLLAAAFGAGAAAFGFAFAAEHRRAAALAVLGVGLFVAKLLQAAWPGRALDVDHDAGTVTVGRLVSRPGFWSRRSYPLDVVLSIHRARRTSRRGAGALVVDVVVDGNVERFTVPVPRRVAADERYPESM